MLFTKLHYGPKADIPDVLLDINIDAEGNVDFLIPEFISTNVEAMLVGWVRRMVQIEGCELN